MVEIELKTFVVIKAELKTFNHSMHIYNNRLNCKPSTVQQNYRFMHTLMRVKIKKNNDSGVAQFQKHRPISGPSQSCLARARSDSIMLSPSLPIYMQAQPDTKTQGPTQPKVGRTQLEPATQISCFNKMTAQKENFLVLPMLELLLVEVML